jgi:hypothetical protein
MISWFTGEIPWPGFADTIIRYYVDSETTPSIVTTIAFLTGSGPVNYTDVRWHLAPPWGTSTVGRIGLGGGAYSTIKVPFSTRIRVTAMMSPTELACGNSNQQCSLYSLIRGIENFGTIKLPYSNLELPSSARLKGVLKRGTTLNATEWTSLASTNDLQGNMDINSISGGALLMVVQSIISENAHALEGTHVASIYDQDDIMLSSGFEDYYLSGQYFDTGKFATPLSGLTAEDHWLEPNKVTAYRFHEADPVVFQKSFDLKWQNGRTTEGSLAAGNTTMDSFVLMYVW